MIKKIAVLIAVAGLSGCSTLAGFINMPASQYQISTILLCQKEQALIARNPKDAILAQSLQTLCATPPSISPTAAQTSAQTQALLQLVNGG